jgi:hypothetical protein
MVLSIKKKTLIISLIILVAALIIIILYTFDYIRAEVLKLNKVTSLDQIPEPKFLSERTIISYFECSTNKQRIVNLCERKGITNDCNSRLATIYLMYLYKTGQRGAPAIINQMLYESGVNKNHSISKEDFSEIVNNFLSKSEIVYPYDLKLVVENNSETINDIISKAENDKNLSDYYQSILMFKSATNQDDCQKMMNETPMGVMSIMLKDACELSFTQDIEEYCESVLDKEMG